VHHYFVSANLDLVFVGALHTLYTSEFDFISSIYGFKLFLFFNLKFAYGQNFLKLLSQKALQSFFLNGSFKSFGDLFFFQDFGCVFFFVDEKGKTKMKASQR